MATTTKHHRTFSNTVSLAEYCFTNNLTHLYIHINRSTGGRTVKSQTVKGVYLSISTKIESLDERHLAVSIASDVDINGNVLCTFPLIHKINKKYHKHIFDTETIMTTGRTIVINRVVSNTSKEIELDNKVHELTSKIYGLAKKVYADFENITMLETYTSPINGTKFILQEKDGKHRLRFDPYQFVDNTHIALSLLFDTHEWKTVSGGWLRTMCSEDNEPIVVLYSHLIGYEPFVNEIATDAANEIFLNHGILSESNKEWSKIWGYDDSIFNDDLPF